MKLRSVVLAFAIIVTFVASGYCAAATGSDGQTKQSVQGEQEGQAKDAPQGKEGAQAERKWTAYSKDRRGINYLYEKETVVIGTDGMIKVWRKREFPIRSMQKEIVTLDEIDCFKQNYRTLEMQVIHWNSAAESYKHVSEWATIYGDSPEEFFLDTTCKKMMEKRMKK